MPKGKGTSYTSQDDQYVTKDVETIRTVYIAPSGDQIVREVTEKIRVPKE